MTEKTLKQAIKLKSEIDEWRSRKYVLETQNALCRGNTSEVMARRFQVTITDGHDIKSVYVGPWAAKLTLENEIKKVDEILDNLLSDLSELN